jgi:hypothetical protein
MLNTEIDLVANVQSKPQHTLDCLRDTQGLKRCDPS